MARHRNETEFEGLKPLLDAQESIDADPAKLQALVAMLTAELEPEPAYTRDWPVFLGLCAGFGVAATLLFLSYRFDVLELVPAWVWPGALGVVAASLLVVGSVALGRLRL